MIVMPASSCFALAVLSRPFPVARRAQDYPNRPVRIIVPTAPGGMSDILSRTFAAKVQERTSTTVVVENKTGASGVLAADYVAKSVPDGYTIYLGFHGTNSVLQHLDAKLPYDPAKDFAPVVFLATGPTVLVVHPSVPVRIRPGAGCAGEKQAGRLELRLGRDRHDAASGGRAVQALCRRRHRRRAVSRGGAGQPGRAGRSRADDVRPDRQRDEQHPRGQIPRARASPRRSARSFCPMCRPWSKQVSRDAGRGMVRVLLRRPGRRPRRLPGSYREANEIFAAKDVADRFTTTGMTLPLGPPGLLGDHVDADSKRLGRGDPPRRDQVACRIFLLEAARTVEEACTHECASGGKADMT